VKMKVDTFVRFGILAGRIVLRSIDRWAMLILLCC
jgi:hypothetical protein